MPSCETRLWNQLAAGGLLFALQALLLPADSPTQLQTVQFPYLDTWEIRGSWGGYSPGYKLIVMLRQGVRCTVVDWFNCEWHVMEWFVKMPRTFTHKDYADMDYVYGYCNSNANAAVDEYRRRYPLCRTQNRAAFTVFCALHECGTLSSVHVSSERKLIQTVEEQDEIVSMVQRSPTTGTCRIASHLCVPQSRVWRTLHYDGLYPFHHQPVQYLHPGDDAHRLELCHWLSHNRELLPYILFTDEATFTRNGITNNRNCHNWAQDNPHATVGTNLQTRFSLKVWCGIINDILMGPAIVED